MPPRISPPARDHERRLRPDGRRCSANAAAMPARRSASPNCRSTPPSRSRPCSRSPDANAADLRSTGSSPGRSRIAACTIARARRDREHACRRPMPPSPGGFGIECDVQLSADGEAMVFHDFTLDRLTGTSGPVVARTAAELGAIRAEGQRSTRIPTLDRAARPRGRARAAGDRDQEPLRRRPGADAPHGARSSSSIGGQPIALKSFDPAIDRRAARTRADDPARHRRDERLFLSRL